MNVIRILREDHLRYYALQSYEEAVAAAEKQGEISAAATLAREMAAYAREGGPRRRRQLRRARAGPPLARGVRRLADARRPPEIAENALLAAVIALGEAGQYSKVGGVYRALAQLPLEETRKKHYARAGAAATSNAQDLPIDASPLPAHLRHELGFPDVWHIDLVEWEQAGQRRAGVRRHRARPGAVVRGHPPPRHARPPDRARASRGGPTRRGGRGPAQQLISARASSSRRSSSTRSSRRSSACSAAPSREIRVAVVRALSRFLYKRTFITIRDALVDPDPTVVHEAARAAGRAALRRTPSIRSPASTASRRPPPCAPAPLRAIAKIDTLEAGEMLLGILQHEGAEERAVAVEALKRVRGMKFVELARGSSPS